VSAFDDQEIAARSIVVLTLDEDIEAGFFAGGLLIVMF
jgi:hypothetical protein